MFLSESLWCFLQVRDPEVKEGTGVKPRFFSNKKEIILPLFWEAGAKIVSNALMHISDFSWNQKRSVATPQTVIKTNATNSRPFFDSCKHGVFPGAYSVLSDTKKTCSYFSEINAVFKILFHNRH